ncbi:Na+/H+ antiporter NhaC family protein, partial [Staphylococcus aureus]
MEVPKDGNACSLFPLSLFVAWFLSVGIITDDVTAMPLNVANSVTVMVALLINRKESFSKKVE